MLTSLFRVFCLFALLLGGTLGVASAQRAAKYGSDFLSGGVGARALGMGGAYVALGEDVTAGYWNPAGLADMPSAEIGYMHAERFSGVVSYDYGAFALPLNARSTVAVSAIRLGVDDIPNTLNAWDRERNTPLPGASDLVSRFSYAHYAFFVSYARRMNDRLSAGVSGKAIRGHIGDFANSWGYSFDAGVRYRSPRLRLAAALQDATRMLQTWSINEDAFAGAGLSYRAFEIPEGGAEYVLPVARLGAAATLPLGGRLDVHAAADVDLAFDGQRAYALNAGDVSFHPRLGLEAVYARAAALRMGVNQVSVQPGGGLSATPTVGAGLMLGSLSVDYGFGDFAGMASDLGFSHRLSLQLRLSGERFARAAEPR